METSARLPRAGVSDTYLTPGQLSQRSLRQGPGTCGFDGTAGARIAAEICSARITKFVRPFAKKSSQMKTRLKTYFLLSLAACCSVLLAAAFVFLWNRRTRIVWQLESTVARIPVGISAEEADAIMGGAADEIPEVDGVLATPVTMLAASNARPASDIIRTAASMPPPTSRRRAPLPHHAWCGICTWKAPRRKQAI